MPKEIRFLFPAAKMPAPPTDANTSRHVYNVASGVDVEIMQEYLFSDAPFVDRETVTTIYSVLYLDRNEPTPSSFPHLRGVLRVHCEGNYLNEWARVEGFFLIEVVAVPDGTNVTYQSLSPGNRFEGLLNRAMPALKDLYGLAS